MSEYEDLPANSEAPHRAAASASDDGLLGRIELIEAQPLEQRAVQFEQVHDELLAELQRGDHGAA
jgi:hypothetical protein